jgi:hypothetical protein
VCLLVICDLVLSLCDVMLRYACRNARLVWGRSDVQTSLDTELSINSIMCFDSIQSTGARASKYEKGATCINVRWLHLPLSILPTRARNHNNHRNTRRYQENKHYPKKNLCSFSKEKMECNDYPSFRPETKTKNLYRREKVLLISKSQP